MGENTKIEWAHHTFNPWEGCQKISPGCDNCYAEARNARFAGGVSVNWGADAQRRRTSVKNWKLPMQWDKDAEAKGIRYRVFCASLADVFDNAVDPQWRIDLLELISDTPNLDWLILTKRVGNIIPMLRLALELIDKADSTGYNKAHETSTTRTSGLRGGIVGRIGDRQTRPGLAPKEADIRPLDGRSEDDSMQTRSGRISHGGRLSSGTSDAGRQAGGGSRASFGVASLQRPDSGRLDHQPQERQQVEQQSGQLGAGNIQRAEAPRDSGARREASRRTGVEAPEDAAKRDGRDRDAKAAQERHDDQGDSGSIRSHSECSFADLPQRDLDARTSLRTWLEAWLAGNPPGNVWLGTTIVNQEEADRDIPKLLQLPAAVRFLSMEPLLGLVDIMPWLAHEYAGRPGSGDDCSICGVLTNGKHHPYANGLDWVIVGGESGAQARPMHPSWARSLNQQCLAACVPFFMKQMGGVRDKRGAMDDLPKDLQVREIPNAA